MKIAAFWRDRRCAVALQFAIMSFGIIGMTGLAVDYGMWNETEATLSVAVNSAAINAVKLAAAAELKNDSNYLTEGQQAGQQWLTVSMGQGNAGAQVSNLTTNVTMGLNGNTISATASASATVTSVFGALFGTGAYQVAVSASASINTATYLNVDILLDNSSSMQIAATPLDIAAMLLITPCSAAGNASGTAGTTYDGFMYSWGSATYTPPSQTGWWPIVLPGSPPVTLTPTGSPQGPSCAGATNGVANANAGTPCAFACHYDGSKPAGQGNDLYALARSTLSPGKVACANATSITQLSNCQIQLRFDVVKEAVQSVIQTMQADTTSLNNLKVGIWQFNSSLSQVFPSSGEASSDFGSASSAVGNPPTQPATADTGIQPDPMVASGSHADTDFNGAASQLAQTVTVAGNGTSASSPRKVLFIVTDGAQDLNASINPISASNCTTFKNMGYTVYVVYMTYYMSPHVAALVNAPEVVSSSGSTSSAPVPAALQACASSGSDYIQASDLPTLTTALNLFLKAALKAPASFTQ